MPRFTTRKSGDILSITDQNTDESMTHYAPVAFYDDFIGADVVIPAAGSAESGCKWVKKIVGAAPPTLGRLANTVNGFIECALTADSQKQNAEAYFGDNLEFSAQQNLVFEARIRPTVLPTGNAEIVVGLISAWADGLDAATYSAFVTLDGSGEIICESDDNVTDRSATSGVTLLATDYALVRIDFSDITNIKFYVGVNGAVPSQVASATTFPWAASAANSKLQPVFGCYKASGTGIGSVISDYVRVWQNRS